MTIAVLSNSPAPITFASDDTAVATIEAIDATSARVTIVGAGSTTITVSQAATTGYTAATFNRTLTVSKAAQAPLVVTTLIGLPGESVTLASTGGTVAGTTTYALTSDPENNACTLSGGQVTRASVGTCTIEATRAGNANYELAEVTATVSFVWQMHGKVSVGQTLTLVAPAGMVFSTVEFASFGTPTGSAGTYARGTCHAANSETAVEGLAIGQTSVSIAARDTAAGGVFDTTCGGSSRELAVSLGMERLPAAVSDLVSTISGGVVNLSWGPATTSGATVDGYRVRWRTVGSSGWATAAASPVSATAIAVPELVEGAEYEVEVTAFNSLGSGPAVSGSVDRQTLSDAVLLYETRTPTRIDGYSRIEYWGDYGVNSDDVWSTIDNQQKVIERVIYRMEVEVDGILRFAEVGFTPWDGVTAWGLRVPERTAGNSFAVQEIVSDLTIRSNMTAGVSSKSSGVTPGSGGEGYLEIWSWNYGQSPTGEAPLGSDSNGNRYDFNDSPSPSGNEHYGSFQVHDVTEGSEPRTVLAWNGVYHDTPDVGLGQSTGTNPDWTFSGRDGTGLGTDDWRLQIFVEVSDATMAASGGVVADVVAGGVTYRTHTFTDVGSSSFVVTDPGTSGEIEYLVVGGGGGGGRSGPAGAGGGGGGGQVVAGTRVLAAGTYTVTVAAGGAGGSGASHVTGAVGGNSAFDTVTALGGGGGGGGNSVDPTAGAGGGGAGATSAVGMTGASSTVGGFRGGDSYPASGAGGGGAGAVGANGVSGQGGVGGEGVSSTITGSTVHYGGGGGGGQQSNGAAGAGGTGGGGAGGPTNVPGSSGSPNTGGGGGGSGGAFDAGAGGSGIVIIRYRISG